MNCLILRVTPISRSLGWSQTSETEACWNPRRPRLSSRIPSPGFGHRVILANTAVDPSSLRPSVQGEIWMVDSNAAITRSGSIQDLLAEEAYTRPQFGLIAISAVAGIGLVLVLIGIFSVMAYTVALQTHELGVRMALGAQQGNVLRMVLWKRLRLISVGTFIGVVASLGMTRFLASQIRGGSVADPWTFCAVVILVLAVGLRASLPPARRAAGIDPLVALRYESSLLYFPRYSHS